MGTKLALIDFKKFQKINYQCDVHVADNTKEKNQSS